ncbi:MAG: hypothetical protein GF411_12985 [Candidatus Lokiarchaeota archaeon]|nr:hypothetical protein [Candidatus Lokiarchaeota archaeon]
MKQSPQVVSTIIFIIGIVLIGSGIVLSVSPQIGDIGVTVKNDIQADMRIYDVSSSDVTGRDSPYLIDDAFDRIFTDLYVQVVPSAVDGIASFKLSIINENSERVYYQSMDQVGSYYESYVDVDGYPTGQYTIKATGVSETYNVIYEETNPNHAWYEGQIARGADEASLRELVMAGAYGGVWPIPETITVTEQREEVSIYDPSPRLVSIKNPWQKPVFTLGISQADSSSPVYFSYTLTEGVVTSMTLVIRAEDGTRVAESKDPDAFVFNENQGQADGYYTATLYVVGASGWTGAQRSVGFTIDNPEDIAGEVTIFISNNERWEQISDGDIISGSVLIRVEITSGEPVVCTAYFDGPTQRVFDMEFDGTYWYVILDTNIFVNGDYSIYVEATRAEDNALCRLSVFDTGVEGSTGQIQIFGAILLVMGLFFVGYWAFITMMPRRR